MFVFQAGDIKLSVEDYVSAPFPTYYSESSVVDGSILYVDLKLERITVGPDSNPDSMGFGFILGNGTLRDLMRSATADTENISFGFLFGTVTLKDVLKTSLMTPEYMTYGFGLTAGTLKTTLKTYNHPLIDQLTHTLDISAMTLA